MLTEEELARFYNQLDLLVQPEGDAALESLMAHIRELQAELNRYDTHAISVALLHRAATTDGAHHKQWLIVRILEAMGEDISAYKEGVQP
jgi:hypothetical protein